MTVFPGLSFLRRFGLGACLADDMGLGKTIQFITYLLHLKETHADGDIQDPFSLDLSDFGARQLAEGIKPICPFT